MRNISGFHAIEELIKSGQAKGQILVSNKGPRVKAIIELALKAKIPIHNADDKELSRLASDHRGIVFQSADNTNDDDVKVDFDEWLHKFDEKNALVVILDHIQDPHNYGAILRSSDQFSVNLVIVPDRRAAKETETVTRSSAGATAYVPQAIVTNLSRAIEKLKDKGFWIWTCNMGGESLYNADLKGRTAIIMGSEGDGVSKLMTTLSDGAIAIPTKGHVDSLNVSVAAGIFMYEFQRQVTTKK